MEDTQAINWEIEEEEETERTGNSLECSLEPLGRLHIFSSVHGPEKDFPLYLGKNVVGRMPDCSVALPFPSISKQHAVIEILAWNKAPVLWDCGSLNGTQILRPPKFLSPGMSHRLRDQELVVFADLPCQYHRLDVSLPFVSRGPLTVEETPRVQGGTHSWGILLAEDSEEEVDPLSEQCMEKKPRAMSSPLATVIPESDEEGPSSAPDGPGPPCAFNLDSDTDEEESPQPAIGEACSAATRNSTADTYQPKAITTETQCEKDQYSGKEKKNDTRAKRDTGNGVVPVGVILERSQPAREDSETDVDDESRPSGRPVEVHLERALPSGFIDSDTDMEEEIPTTPATVPAKKRQILSGVSTESSGGPDLAHLQESLAGNDIDMETEVSLTIPLEHSQASMVISNNTDDEQEMSAALTLAHLKESQAALRNRGTGIVEDRGQSLALLSQTSSGRDSDTDKEEEKIPVEKREYIPNGHTDKAHSEKSRPPFRDSDREVEEDKSSPRIHLERSRAFATVGICTQVEEEVPPGPAVTFLNKDQVPMAWTNQANQTNVEAEEDPAKLPVVHLEEAQPNPGGDCETDADVRKSQLPTERDAGTEWVVPSLQQETALEAGAQGGPPIAQVEQDHLVSGENLTGLLVDTGTAEEPTQLQRKRAQHPRESGRKPHVDMTKDSGDNHDDSENIDLQATQCFVERENQTTEGTLDEPWEVLATQPFCLRESEASDTQSVAIHLDAHGSCPFSLRATPQDQHPENPFCIESLGIQGRGMQTVEKGIGTLEESAVRVTLERGPVGVETKKLPVEGSRENVIGEKELTRVMKDREQKQILVRDTQRQESNNMVKSTSMEKDMESLKEEIETPKELLEVVNQTLAREVFEKEAEKPAPETECEPDGLEVSIPKVILEGGTQRLGTKSGNWDQKGQTISSPTLEPEGEAEDLMGLSSALIASGSQSSGRRRAPVCPRRWQRGHLNCKMPNAEKISRGDPESLDACLPPTVPEASAPVQNPFVSQSQKYPPQALFASSPHSLEPPIPRTRQNGSQEVLENPLSSELDPLCGKPKVRPQRCSRMTPSPVSSVALESQPVTPEPTSRATRGRTHRSSNKMLEPVVPTAPELQPSTSKDQPVTPEPKSQAARGRACRSSVKTPEPVVLTASELQPSTSKGQPVTPEPTSQATWGRTCRSSVKIPEPVVPTAPELQPSTSKDQPVTPEPTSRAARGRTCRSSVKIPEPVVLTAPELQPSTSKDQPVTLQPTSLATWGRIHRSSVKTYQTTEPTSLDLGPPTPTYQSVTHKAIAQGGQSRTLRPRRNAVPVSTTLEFQYPVPKDQPISLEPIPQAYCGRRPRSTRKHGSLTAPVVYEPCSAPLESNSVSSRNQKRGAVRAAKSLRAIPEPEAPTHVFQIQKVESAGRCEFTPETQPKASQNRKRPSGTVASPLLQKRVQRGEVPQKTVFLKEEEYTAKKPEKEEDVIIPGPGKRKKEQAKEVPGRSLRRTKPKHGPIAPKVLFTGVVDAHGEQIVLTLGGSLASSVVEASHLVTDRICRTVKFLCALGRGIPILSLDWLHQSHKAGCFLCPDDYVVTDFEQEKNFGFSLRESLSRARERRLLEGYEIHVTPGVQPPPPQMAEIISCCGGTILPSMPRSYKPQRVVITCSQDIPRCCTPLRVGLPILSPEFLLTGVLKQEAKPEAFVLSTLEMSST